MNLYLSKIDKNASGCKQGNTVLGVGCLGCGGRGVSVVVEQRGSGSGCGEGWEEWV